MTIDRSLLLNAARVFCEAFAERKDVDYILSLFSYTHSISAIEYGDPILAPFLGKECVGVAEIKAYFELLASLLTYENVSFSEYFVDTEVMKVSVKGQGTFTWLSSKQSWAETFTYTLDFDPMLKVVRYQVWADSGSAYLARKGRLNDVKNSGVSEPEQYLQIGT